MAETTIGAPAAEESKQQDKAKQEPKQRDEQSGTKPSRKKFIVPMVILALLIIGAIVVWRVFFSKPEVPDSVVVLSGRIEGDDSAVSPKTSGRILEIHFREGDTVKADDVIAVLDDQQIKAREQQAEAAVVQSEAAVRSAEQQIAILGEQLQQSDLQTTQSKTDAEGKVKQAQAELAGAEAQLAQQEATLKLALFDRQAYTKLAKTGAVSERQGEQAVSNADTQQAATVAARRRVEAARAAVTVAEASLANPSIRSAQSAAVRRQMAQQQTQVASAQADLARARALLAEAQANRRDLIVRAPFAGTVATRAAEPGEVIQAGTPIVTLLDMSKVYLRGFVPEGQIGKLKVGQRARVYLDSSPKQPVDAYVSRIDPQATFTPENTYFREDRVKQVVGAKLQLTGAAGFAKPGMPADGEVLVSGDRWPSRDYQR